jgi:hypothetical protein
MVYTTPESLFREEAGAAKPLSGVDNISALILKIEITPKSLILCLKKRRHSEICMTYIFVTIIFRIALDIHSFF